MNCLSLVSAAAVAGVCVLCCVVHCLATVDVTAIVDEVVDVVVVVLVLVASTKHTVAVTSCHQM